MASDTLGTEPQPGRAWFVPLVALSGLGVATVISHSRFASQLGIREPLLFLGEGRLVIGLAALLLAGAWALFRRRVTGGMLMKCLGRMVCDPALLVLVVVYMTGINSNLYMLAFALSAYGTAVASAPALRRWVLAVFVLVTLSSVPAPLPPQVNVREGFPDRARPLEAGERVAFRFALRELSEHETRRGLLQGSLMIVGHGLEGLAVTVNGRLADTAGLRRDYAVWDVELLEVPLERVAGESLMVELAARPGAAPAVYQGPEVAGLTAYPDAVYLLFRNPDCRVLYHARREVAD